MTALVGNVTLHNWSDSTLLECDGRLRHCARLCSYMLRLAVVYTFCTSNRTLASRLHTFARELALRYPLARVPRLLCSLLRAYGLSASKPTEYLFSTVSCATDSGTENAHRHRPLHWIRIRSDVC